MSARHAPTTRATALALYASGINVRQVALTLGISKNSVARWVAAAEIGRHPGPVAKPKPRSQPEPIGYEGGWVRHGLILRPTRKAS